MSTISVVSTIDSNPQLVTNIKLVRHAWLPMTTTADTGSAVSFSIFSDRSAQVHGTFGVGGEITIEGSKDGGTTFVPLTDPQGNSLRFTTAGIKAVTEICEFIRPRVTGGDGTTSLQCYIFAKQGK